MKFVSNMFGDDFDLNHIIDQVEPDPLKQSRLKSAEFQDQCMKSLQEKSFKGLFLRL